MSNTEVRDVRGSLDPYSDNGQGTDLNLGEFLEVLRQRWWVLVVLGVVGALVGLGIGLLRPTVYETTASGVLIPTGDVSLSEEYAGENLAKSRATTYESVSTTRPVAEAVVAELGLDVQPEELLPRISTSVPVETSEIRVTAQGPTPEAAQELADAWVRALSSTVESLDGDRAVVDQAIPTTRVLSLVPVGSAYLPEDPTGPQLALVIGGGALLGLLVGLGAAVSGTDAIRRVNKNG